MKTIEVDIHDEAHTHHHDPVRKVKSMLDPRKHTPEATGAQLPTPGAPEETIHVYYHHVVHHKLDAPSSGLSGLIANLKSRMWGFANRVHEAEAGVKSEVHNAREATAQRAHDIESSIHDRAHRAKHLVADKVRGAHEGLHAVKDAAGNKLYEVKEDVEKKIDDAQAHVEAAKEGVKSKARDAKASVLNAKDDIKSNVHSKANRAKEHVAQTFRNAQAGVENTKDRVESKYHDIKEDIKEGVDHAKHKTEEKAQGVRGALQSAADSLKGFFWSAENEAKSQYEFFSAQPDDDASGDGQGIWDQVDGGWRQAGDKLHHAKNVLKDKASDAKNTVEHDWSMLRSQLGQKFDKLPEQWTGTKQELMEHISSLNEPAPIDGNSAYAPLTALYGAILALYFVRLALRVWKARRATKIYVGDGSIELLKASLDESPVPVLRVPREKSGRTAKVYDPISVREYEYLSRSVEALRSFTTNASIALLLLCIMELSGYSRLLLHYLYVTLLVGVLLDVEAGIFSTGFMSFGRREAGLYTIWAVIGMAAIACTYSVASQTFGWD